MVQWVRKHMGEVAWVAKRCASLYDLPPEQREAMEQARSKAHSLSTGVRDLRGNDDVTTAISLLCSACAQGLPGGPVLQCNGRTDWREQCDLIARMTS